MVRSLATSEPSLILAHEFPSLERAFPFPQAKHLVAEHIVQSVVTVEQSWHFILFLKALLLAETRDYPAGHLSHPLCGSQFCSLDPEPQLIVLQALQVTAAAALAPGTSKNLVLHFLQTSPGHSAQLVSVQALHSFGVITPETFLKWRYLPPPHLVH